MNKKMNDPFTVLLPHLDLHGETSESAKYLINSFIKDNYLMQNKRVIIIHGKSGGILKNTTQETLKNNKYVDKYKIDMFNDGQTIVEIKNKK